MKKSSRDRRVFRRLERRLSPSPLYLIPDMERWNQMIIAKAYCESLLSRVCIASFVDITEYAKSLDISQIQKAFTEVKTACENLSKVKINISIY
jgi:hypothetical protein